MKKFTLNSGRRVSLAELHQRSTYAGVLAGKPETRLNQAVLDSILDEAKGYGFGECQPKLISPSAEAIAGRLPPIACIAVLHSNELTTRGSEPYSTATLVWLQAQLEPLIPDYVAQYIAAMDWEAVATEWCP